jgi:putative endonuclease
MHVRWLTRWFGNRGEQAAVRHLKGAGWTIVAAQVATRFGELDIIAQDRDTLVFVEVKTRRSVLRGRPEEAVDAAKQQRIVRSALAWLKRKGWLDRRIRFDVVSVVWQDDATPVITHYQHAFEPAGFGQMYS